MSDRASRKPDGTSASWTTTWKHPSTENLYTLSLSRSRATSDGDLDACFALIEETSKQDYESSSRGWNPKAKHKEMREADLRYILVKDPAGRLGAYMSLMPTMEEGEAVVYCYEIHLRPDLRGTGLADLLMGFLETVARNIEVMKKVMLTVFLCNTRAVRFYRRCGFETDDSSPWPRKLRNGVVKRPDYEILSKRVGRQRGESRQHDMTFQTSTPRPAKMAKKEHHRGSGSDTAAGEG